MKFMRSSQLTRLTRLRIDTCDLQLTPSPAGHKVLRLQGGVLPLAVLSHLAVPQSRVHPRAARDHVPRQTVL